MLSKGGAIWYNFAMDTEKDWFLPHLRVGVEWWYFTGLLNNRFGFEVSIFMSEPRMLPMSTYFPFVRSFLAHFAIFDREKDMFYFEEKTRIADISRLSQGKSLLNLDVSGINVLSNGANYIIGANTEKFTLSLLLQAKKPVIPHGDGGIISMLNGDSYYYSVTNMEASGFLRNGNEFLKLSGSAWHDHQFGNFTVKGVAWDWFSLRFSNNIEIMAFLLKDKKGNVEKYGTLVKTDGSAIPINNFKITTLETKNNYPVKWQFEFEEGNFIVQSVSDKQVIRSKLPFVPQYAEMLSDVNGMLFGENVSGYAYVEIVK